MTFSLQLGEHKSVLIIRNNEPNVLFKTQSRCSPAGTYQNIRHTKALNERLFLFKE